MFLSSSFLASVRLFFVLLLSMVLVVVISNIAHAQYQGFDDPGARQTVGSGSGGLVPVESNVDGGVIPAGASSQVVVRFRNEGSQPIKTGIIRLYPSSTVSAQITMNQCKDGALESGAECAIALSVKALQIGAWRVEMLMSHSGRTRLVTATLSGQVETSGDGASQTTSDVEMIPDKVDFGSVSAAQALFEPVILKNITSLPIQIDDIYIDSSESAGYVLNTACDKLDPGQACIATVSWSPKVKGASSGVMVVKHSGPTGLSSVVVKGEYNPSSMQEASIFPEAIPGKGLLVSSQTDVDFGSGIVTASTIAVSLVNAGDTPLTLQDIRISGSDNGLSFRKGGCVKGMVLDPVEACPLTLYWSPSRSGAIIDDLQIVHDGARGVLILPVRGEADSAVSQDQKAIVLKEQPAILMGGMGAVSSQDNIMDYDGSVDRNREGTAPQRRNIKNASFGYSAYGGSIANPASVLDGYAITSFARDRAIINGPSGSRIVFDGEDLIVGGLPLLVDIQRNGIQFKTPQGQRILLLFDRSLSALKRISDNGGNGSISSTDSGATETSN